VCSDKQYSLRMANKLMKNPLTRSSHAPDLRCPMNCVARSISSVHFCPHSLTSSDALMFKAFSLSVYHLALCAYAVCSLFTMSRLKRCITKYYLYFKNSSPFKYIASSLIFAVSVVPNKVSMRVASHTPGAAATRTCP
jgi:magnesium-transporting ATPase (P-type)